MGREPVPGADALTVGPSATLRQDATLPGVGARCVDGDSAQALQAFVSALRAEVPLSAVILFGSRARGDHLLTSDVDVLVISAAFAQWPHLRRLEWLFARWARVSRLGADVVGLTPGEFADRAGELSVVGEIAREGVVVYRDPAWRRPELGGAQ